MMIHKRKFCRKRPVLEIVDLTLDQNKKTKDKNILANFP